MDKFYMSIFVYILESRNVILENEKIEQLKDVLEKEIAEQTEYILSKSINPFSGESLPTLTNLLFRSFAHFVGNLSIELGI